MSGGIKYTDKDDLLNKGVIARVFSNTNFAVTAKGIQSAMCDMVESLWSDCGCETTTFTASSTYIEATVTRKVIEEEVSILVDINFLDNKPGAVSVADTVTIADILPLDFKGKKWFKPLSVFSIVSANDGLGAGDFGFLTMPDLSTYTAGAAVADDTRLFMPGVEVGAQRSFVYDGADTNLGGYDLVEPANTNNYITKSPKDLTVGALSITIDNMEEASGGTGSQRNQFGTIQFYMKGILL